MIVDREGVRGPSEAIFQADFIAEEGRGFATIANGTASIAFAGSCGSAARPSKCLRQPRCTKKLLPCSPTCRSCDTMPRIQDSPGARTAPVGRFTKSGLAAPIGGAAVAAGCFVEKSIRQPQIS